MHRAAVALAVIALHLSASGASGHVGTRIYPIYEVPSQDLPDLHDGSFEDWLDIAPSPSIEPVDFVSVAGPSAGPDDLAVQGYLLWHARSQRLYIGFRRVDDVAVDWYDGTDPGKVNRFDSIVFAVDGDHSGGAYCTGYSTSAEHLSLTGFQAQRYHSIVTSYEGGILEFMRELPNEWVAEPPYADMGAHKEGVGPCVSWSEMYVTAWDGLRREGPELSTRTALEPGAIVGFSVLVFDNDLGTERVEEAYQLGGDGDVWNADRFVDGTLIPCATSDCSGGPGVSAVRPDTWARIKASFR